MDLFACLTLAIFFNYLLHKNGSLYNLLNIDGFFYFYLLGYKHRFFNLLGHKNRHFYLFGDIYWFLYLFNDLYLFLNDDGRLLGFGLGLIH